jgi:hypothetical protein
MSKSGASNVSVGKYAARSAPSFFTFSRTRAISVAERDMRPVCVASIAFRL